MAVSRDADFQPKPWLHPMGLSALIAVLGVIASPQTVQAIPALVEESDAIAIAPDVAATELSEQRFSLNSSNFPSKNKQAEGLDEPAIASDWTVSQAKKASADGRSSHLVAAEVPVVEVSEPVQELPDQAAIAPLALADESLQSPVELAQLAEFAIAQDAATEAVTDSLETAPDSQDFQGSPSPLDGPVVEYQSAAVLQGDEFSARARVSAVYAVSPQVIFGGTLDLTTGEAFADSREEGLSLNELYVAASPEPLPNLQFVAGLLDLTSYFDRNSFAKDGVTHFFNPVFQTNPALSAAGMASRPGFLVNWSVVDNVEVKAATFSSTRDLSDFALDGVAGEVGVRLGNAIVRGTYVSARDAGEQDGFQEIFQFDRGDGVFGLRDGDREAAYGLNAEWFIPDLNLGLFGRYGWYENRDLDEGGQAYSLGMNALDVFTPNDRLGLAYGRQLSNRDRRSGEVPDVWELFYDLPLASWLRTGVSIQGRDEFSETIVGLRLRANWD